MKFNFFKFGIIAIFISLTLYAQSGWEQMFTLYQQKDFKTLKAELERKSGADTASVNYRFFKAVFTKDAQKAKEKYENVFNHASGRLKQMAAQKLHDYYYALGYYVRASWYGKYVGSESENTENLEEKSTLAIQFGAFSTRLNALRRQTILKQAGVSSSIVKRNINGKQLFCVWVEGKPTVEETRKLADQIKKQLNLDYRIINR